MKIKKLKLYEVEKIKHDLHWLEGHIEKYERLLAKRKKQHTKLTKKLNKYNDENLI